MPAKSLTQSLQQRSPDRSDTTLRHVGGEVLNRPLTDIASVGVTPLVQEADISLHRRRLGLWLTVAPSQDRDGRRRD
jgi:hypothetical protein